MSQRILIENGLVIDPVEGTETQAHVVVEDGKISAVRPVAEGLPETTDGFHRIDATGCWVTSGFLDLRTHLREPGEEWKETVESGVKAAVAGGFTGICAMPDTTPVNDEAAVTNYIRQQGELAALARVYPVGAATQGQAGETLADIGDMKAVGAVAVSNGNHPIESAQMMRRVMEYASTYKLPVLTCSYEASMSDGGLMHEGLLSTRLGLAPIPSAAETIAVSRDIALAELTGARVHIGRLSTAGAVEMVKKAREGGVAITAEVTPHHLILTEEALLTYDTNTKVIPPLRSETDRMALIQGLKDGVITCIATDHSPQNIADKELEFVFAEAGMVGLETTISLLVPLIADESLDRMTVIRALTTGPAAALGMVCDGIRPGVAADIAVINPDKKWMVTEDSLESKSFNTPFLGQEMAGKTVATLVEGRLVFEESEETNSDKE